jgi:hypothetical protein
MLMTFGDEQRIVCRIENSTRYRDNTRIGELGRGKIGGTGMFLVERHIDFGSPELTRSDLRTHARAIERAIVKSVEEEDARQVDGSAGSAILMKTFDVANQLATEQDTFYSMAVVLEGRDRLFLGSIGHLAVFRTSRRVLKRVLAPTTVQLPNDSAVHLPTAAVGSSYKSESVRTSQLFLENGDKLVLVVEPDRMQPSDLSSVVVPESLAPAPFLTELLDQIPTPPPVIAVYRSRTARAGLGG